MTTGKALDGKPYTGNPHVRFDEGEVAPAATPRRGSLLYHRQLLTIGAAAFALTVNAETITAVPDAYLDYIEATGQQYINTEVNAETGLKARADFSWGTAVTSSDDWGLLCAKDGKSGDSSTRMLMIHLGSNMPYVGYGLASRGNPGNATTFTRNVRGEIVADFSDYNVLQVYQNGTNTLTAANQATYAARGNVDLGIPLYAFAYNQAGTAGGKCKAKLYELKIMKKNGSGGFDIVRHYLPCLKNGHAALYDKANGTISFSDSGTDFVAGPELSTPCELVEWIESLDGSTGSYIIDTRVYGKSGIRSEVDCMIRSGFTTDQAILACRWAGSPSDTRFFLAYFYQSYFGYGYKTGYWPKNVPVQNNKDYRYRIESDLSVGHQSVKVNGTELHKDGDAHDNEFFSPRTTLSLFALHTGSEGNYPASSNIRLFSTKIWDGDEILRDFVPCVDSAGEAGLYDRVTERVFKSPTAYSLATQVGGCTNWLSFTPGTRPDKRIEYIESNGKDDYIDVGVMAKDGVEMEAEMEWLTVPSDGAFVSARTDALRFFPYHYYSGYHRLGYANELYAFGTAAVTNQRYKVKTRLDNGSQAASISAFVNGAWGTPVSTSWTATGPVDMGLSLYLFARNFKGKADYPGHARVYRLKFSEKQQDGSYKLTRDFGPVKKDGKSMLWDKVSETFFRNNGNYLIAGGGWEREWSEGTVVEIR